MGVNIVQSRKAEEANVARIQDAMEQSRKAFLLERQQRAGKLAADVGAIQVAAGVGGVSGTSVQVSQGSEVASSSRAQFIANASLDSKVRQLDNAISDVRTQARADRINAGLQFVGQALGSASKIASTEL